MRFMRAFLFLLFAAPLEVAAQSSLLMGGSTSKGHVPCFVSNGTSQPIAIDCGPAGGNTTGQGISELNVTAIGTGTAPYSGQGTGIDGTVFQIQDAVSTNAAGYHYLSFSANALGGGLIEYGAAGAATPLPLNFKFNGTSYAFPFVLSGIVGPGSSIVNDFMCWNNVSGTLAKDCGFTTGTSGHAVPFLDGNNTYSGTANFTNTFQKSGVTENFPASGNIVGTTDTQTISGKSNLAIANGSAISGAVIVNLDNRAGNELTLYDFGGVCNGSNDDAPAFTAANAAGFSISIPVNTGGNCQIKTNVNISSIQITMPPTSRAISVGAGITVTMGKAPIANPQQQIFSLGAGATTPITSANQTVYAEWWGAKADNSTASGPALQAAANSLINGGTIQLLTGNYQIACASADGLTITNGSVNIYGATNQSSWLRPTTNCARNLINVNVSGQSGNFRDFGINGSGLGVAVTAYAYTGILCSNCGVSDFTHLQFYGVKTGINGMSVTNTKWTDIYIQQCTSTCFIVGGGTANQAGVQVASIVMMDTIYIFPGNTTANGLLFDSGANEIIVQRTEIGGANQGVTLQNTSSGGHKPENIRLITQVLSASATCNVCLFSAWATQLRDSAIGSNGSGASVLINAAATKSDVDGVEITNNQIRGAFTDDIYIQQGANVFISGNTIYAASSAAGAAVNTGSAIRVGVNAVGAVDILNNNLGSEPLYANIQGTQGRSVLLDSASLANYTDGSGNLFTGRLSIQTNTMINNSIAALTDSGTSATTKRILNNPGYNPVGPSALSVTASPMTYTAGASPEIICLTGNTITSVTVGGLPILGAITTTGACVPLAPQQAMVLTYPGAAPTATKSVQ